MKKIRLTLVLLAAITAIVASGCSIHENFHDGRGRRPWGWHYRHW